MKAFAEFLRLKDESLRATQAYCRRVNLLAVHYDKDPKYLTQTQVRSYIVHLKAARVETLEAIIAFGLGV